VWRPQFHLHVDARTIERQAQGASGGVLAAAVRHEVRRVVLHHHWTSVRSAGIATSLHPPRGTGRPVQAAKAAVSGTRASVVAVVGARTPTVARAIAPLLVPRLRRASAARSTDGSRRVARSDVPRVDARPGARALQALHVPRLALAVPAPRPVHDGGVPPVRSERPAELVWRAALRSTAGASSGARHADRAAPSPQVPSAAPFPRPEAGVEAPARAADGAAVRITDLDPRLLDRVTDDVIRRVERRVRIERERRGL
jgi:hypothetical protein